MEVHGAEDQDDPVSLYVGITIFFLDEMRELICGHNKQRIEAGSKAMVLSMTEPSQSIEDIVLCVRAGHFPGAVSILVLLCSATRVVCLVSAYIRTCSRNSSNQWGASLSPSSHLSSSGPLHQGGDEAEDESEGRR